MSSNSIRVGASLFEEARQRGELMSRSAAQQIEHWARLGAALEATGATVEDLAGLLHRHRDVPGGGSSRSTEQALWSYKRIRQARDLENVRSGRATNDQMSWFSGGRARGAKLVNSPY